MRGESGSRRTFKPRIVQLSDELPSSWLIRVAKAYQETPHTTARWLLGDIPSWNRDIDQSLDPEILASAATQIGSDPDVARSSLVGDGDNNALQPGLLRLGLKHRIRTRHGLLYCARCLSERKPMYFRRRWRFAFSLDCEYHDDLLADSCPHCDQPVNPHRSPGLDVKLCFACGEDMTTPGMKTKERVVRFRRLLQEACDKGYFRFRWGEIPLGELRTVLRFWFSKLRSPRISPVLSGRDSFTQMPVSESASILEDSRVTERVSWLPCIAESLAIDPGDIPETIAAQGMKLGTVIDGYRGRLPGWFESVLIQTIPAGPSKSTRSQKARSTSPGRARRRVGLTRSMAAVARMLDSS